jgi:tRNA threonylcarbamoyladenosine biosynthesis protein TsaB
LALLLNIETASPVCSVALALDGSVIGIKEISEQADHSSILTVLIDELIKEQDLSLKSLDAIAVSAGPGSYTGLRIGAATAKGLCYALSKPLIAIDSLQSLACGMYKNLPLASGIYCPTIDARRDEIYYGLFEEGKIIMESSRNIILHPDFLAAYKPHKNLVVGGSGVSKCRKIATLPLAAFDEITEPSAKWMASLSENKWQQRDFHDIYSFEPFYIKPAFISFNSTLS